MFYTRMSADYEYLKDKHILVFKSSLLIRIQSSVETMQRGVDLINHYNCRNVLCDFRDTNMNFTTITTIQRPKMWEKLGLPRGIKIASVFNKIDDNDKAIKWLSKQ